VVVSAAVADRDVTTEHPPSLNKSLDEAPMSRLHVHYWLLAGLGIMLDGFDFFIIGVANPLIAQDFGINATEKGLVSSAAIVGAIFGAGLLGPLGDKLGRRRIFKFDLILFVVFSLLCIAAWNVWSLIAFRFVLGIAIGLDYPIAASYLAEVLPKKARGRWLTGAFSLQAAGILLGACVGVVLLEALPDVDTWRWMLGFGAIPAVVIIFLRRKVPESPRWLAQNGREDEAKEVAEELTGHAVAITEKDSRRERPVPEGLKALFQPELFRSKLRRRTIFTAVPWFLMDIATYGVGIFTPTLLAAITINGANTTFLADDISATKGTAALDIFLVIGFAIAIVLVDRWGRIPLQVMGFAVMAVALGILSLAEGLTGGGDAHIGMVFVGFALFNTFMNAGPNATTYTLAAEVFPSEYRAAGQGFAASMAKFGAAFGVFLFPILQDDIGTSALLAIIAGCCLVALVVTLAFKIETRGKSLEDLGGKPLEDISGRKLAAVAPRPAPP
jgi:MFS family permease